MIYNVSITIYNDEEETTINFETEADTIEEAENNIRNDLDI